MGPIKYHNVVATLRGTTYPDEYIVIGGHFDCFSGGTGGVDDGSGFAPGHGGHPAHRGGRREAEALDRLHPLRGRRERPGRLAGLAEEAPRAARARSSMMINRDGSPSAITGATVPETWYADFQTITAPLAEPQPEVAVQARAGRAAGARHEPRRHRLLVVRDGRACPTLNFATTARGRARTARRSPYTYSYAWHTLNDLYSELVPYTEHQQHSALVTAVVAYGVANLDKPLTRDGVYLADGLYADAHHRRGRRRASRS